MIRIRQYGLELRLMDESQKEKVRQWRNAPHVQENFEYQEEISQAQHAEWFEKLDPRTNLYFLIYPDEVPIGVLHLKNINWETYSSEAGIFIGEPSWMSHFVPAVATLVLMEFAFQALGLTNLEAKVNREKTHILDFNFMLGYEALPDQPEDQQFLRLRVSPESFFERTITLRKHLQKKSGSAMEVAAARSHPLTERFERETLNKDTRLYIH